MKRRRFLATLAPIVITSIAGAFLLTRTRTPADDVDGLTVSRFSRLDANLFDHFSPRLVRTEPARALHRMVLGLPIAETTNWCPIDFGLAYRLEWISAGATVLTATAEAGGCRLLRFESGKPRAIDDAFWRELGNVVGLSREELAPRPLGL